MIISKYTTLVLLIYSLAINTFDLEAQATDLNPNSLKLTIVGNSYSDQTLIRIVAGSTHGFDLSYDAYKLMGIEAAPQIYSIIDCCILSINSLPKIFTNHKVHLGTRFGANTSYTINAEGLYTFGADTSIFLEDTQENILVDLSSDSTYNFIGTPEDEPTRFKVYINYPATLNLKAILSGAWNGTNMNTNLYEENLIPQFQPYNLPPWNYPGNESVDFIPNPNIVDWVLVEIRDATNATSATSSNIVEQQACFLLKDGSIVSTDGSSLPTFLQTIERNLFVVIHHRNHLSIMSSIPLTKQNGIYSFDFSSSFEQVYGGNLAHKNLSENTFGLFGGDANTDGVINSLDKISLWEIITGNKGYYNSDFNLNGQINNPDKNEVWYLDINQSTQIP